MLWLQKNLTLYIDNNTNINNMELNFNELSNQGFPYCAKCGGVLYWQDNKTAAEEGFHIDDNVDDELQTVHILTCEKCGHTYLVCNEQVLEDYSEVEDS